MIAPFGKVEGRSEVNRYYRNFSIGKAMIMANENLWAIQRLKKQGGTNVPL